MTKFNQIHNFLYQEINIHSPRERRKLLIDEMEGLTNKKIHCFNCAGTCCTFSANSMQITPIEAFEILISLEATEANLEDLKSALQKNILDYRLNHEIFLGKKINSLLRKTYTCPFFIAGAKGCTIKKELKPYGCLGFNPRIENDNGGQCHSNIELLESRENIEIQNEENANTYLKQELQLDWVKLEIPKAVLALIDKIF
jgi:Fe-S-cluster containining protein